MPRLSSKSIFAVLAAAAAIATASFLLSSRSVPVRAAIDQKDIRVRVFGLGTVEAQVIAKLGFEVGAALTEVKVDHGDKVRKGDILARLHEAEQVAKVAKAKAGVQSARVATQKAEANLAKSRTISVQKDQVNRRRQELAGRQTVSAQTAEEAQKDADVAQADVAVATADLEVLRAALSDAEAQSRYEEIILDHHVLRAPFDGIVVDRMKEAGTVLKSGDPIITLVAPETVWVLAHVDESRSGAISTGQPAEVRLRSLPQKRFSGRVERIGIESDRVTEERRVWVKCVDCPEAFHLGEQAEVLISVASLSSARLVSEAAVQGFDGHKGRVWVVEQGRLGQREITFSHRTEDARLVVADTVPASFAIVADPVPGLAVGRSARIEAGGRP